MLLALAALIADGGRAQAQTGGVPQVPEARPGDIAIFEELVAARASRSVEAYRLFLARHPLHPLAKVARAELNSLLAERKRL